MIYLRYNTASQEILLGRFVDSTDGNTEETALTIANTDIKLWKNGGTTVANKNSGGATHISNGLYYAVLDATDTDTVGPLEIHVHVTGALYVTRQCCVLPQKVYDSLIAGSDNLEVDLIQWIGTAPLALSSQRVQTLVGAILAGVIDAAAIGTGAIDADAIADGAIDAGAIATGAITNAKFAAGAIDVTAIADNAITAAKIASNAIAAAKIASNAITAAKIATDAITADKIAADAVGSSEFSQAAADKIWASAVRALTDKAGFSLANASILATTFATDAINAAVLAADAVAEIQANLATSANQITMLNALTTIDTVVDNISTRIPAALSGDGDMRADVEAVNGDTTKAQALRAALQGDGDAGTIKADVYTIQTDALTSIDNAIVNGGNVPADMKAVDGDSGKATLLASALTTVGGVDVVRSDVRAIDNDTTPATELKNALNHVTNTFIQADVRRINGSNTPVDTLEAALPPSGTKINAQVKGIDTDALTSIDSALSLTHGPGSWDATASGPVTVMSIQASALQSIDDALIAGGNLPVDLNAIRGVEQSAIDLKYALYNPGGYHQGRIYSDVQAIGTDSLASIDDALVSGANLPAQVKGIDTDALTSIDTVLSDAHGSGDWDATATGPVTVMAIETGALQSIDSVLVPRFVSIDNALITIDTEIGDIATEVHSAAAEIETIHGQTTAIINSLTTIDTAIDDIQIKVGGLSYDGLGNVNADTKAINGVADKAVILHDALKHEGGRQALIKADIQEIAQEQYAVRLRDALLVDNTIRATVKTIETDALSSIDTKLEPRFTNIQNALTTIDTVVDTINSDGAKEATLDNVEIKIDGLSTMPTAINNVQLKVNSISVVADAIKDKTDNLPADPTSETSATANKEAILDAVDLIPDGIWSTTGLDAMDETSAGKMLWKSMAIHYMPFRTWHPSWKIAYPNSIWIQLFDDSGIFTEPHVIYEARAYTSDGVSNPTLNATDISARAKIQEV